MGAGRQWLHKAAVGDTFTWTGDALTKGWSDKSLISVPPDPTLYVNNWGRQGNPPAFPGSADDAVIGSAAVVLSQSISPAIASLDLGGTASLTIYNGYGLTLNGDSTLDGSVRLADTVTAGWADLKLDSSVAPGGTGSVVFDSNSGNRILSNVGSYVLTVGPSQTIRTAAACSGEIRTRLTNNGLIDADAGTILLAGYAKTNAAVIRARNGSTLEVSGITVTNTGGTLTVDPTSTLVLNAATVTDGTIDGGGAVDVSGTATLDGVHLDNVTATIAEGEALTLRNAITHDGTIRLADTVTAGWADLKLDSSVALSGGGQVVFATLDVNRIVPNVSTYVLTLGPAQTLAAAVGGSGQVLSHLTNHGTVRADGTIQFAAGKTFTNAADGRLAGSGTLDLNGATFVNDGATGPGASPGVLEFLGDFSQSATAVLEIDIEGDLVGDEYDRLEVTGEATLGGWLDVVLDDAFHPDPGDTFDVLTATGGVIDDGLSLLPEDASAWQLNWLSGTLQVEYVPEPGTLALLALGGLGMMARLVRRRK